MNETDVQNFWQANPCDDWQVGGLEDKYKKNYEDFFTAYDEFRYTQEAHILNCLDDIDFGGKSVLEIGLGQGADSEQIIRRGGNWSGVDLTQESVDRLKVRLELRELPFSQLKQGSVLELPFETDSFDIVFSHGVLHHVPDILQAQKEIRRVLKPNGRLIIMMYAKWSLNYLVSISVIRRVGLLGLMMLRRDPGGIYSHHIRNARDVGVFEYLKMGNFIHRNTDGPGNPYAKVYDVATVRKDFPDFEVRNSFKQFMHAPPLPVSWLPLQRVLGWHIWIELDPRSD